MLRRAIPALVVLALLAGLFLTSTATAEDDARKLLGRWLFANQQLGVEYVFGADGRFHRHVVTTEEEAEADGDYKLKGGKLVIDADDEAATTLNCKFNDDGTLELTDDDGNGLRFSRAPHGPLLKPDAPKKTAEPDPDIDDLLEEPQPAATPQPQPEPAAPAETVDDLLDDAADAEPLITPAQLKKLSILLRKQGFDSQEGRHGFVAAAINRDIGSAKELTKDEASKVIDILEDSGGE